MIPCRIARASAVLLALAAAGCSFILRHTANITEAPDVEVVRLPADFQLQPRIEPSPASDHWVLAQTSVAGHLPTGVEPSEFDLSAFLARDPWLGLWGAPLPTEQQVFVRAAGLPRAGVGPGDWRERFVVQLADNQGPAARRGVEENGRLAFDDIARVLCPSGVRRELIASDPTQAIYQSRFVKCPRFGSDRVVLTRELFGNWDTLRHSQAVYTFSYEVRGSSFTAAQRAEGLRLVEAPVLEISTREGDKHPLWRGAHLRTVTAERSIPHG